MCWSSLSGELLLPVLRLSGTRDAGLGEGVLAWGEAVWALGEEEE